MKTIILGALSVLLFPLAGVAQECRIQTTIVVGDGVHSLQDVHRRAQTHLQGMSYREFLKLTKDCNQGVSELAWGKFLNVPEGVRNVLDKQGYLLSAEIQEIRAATPPQPEPAPQSEQAVASVTEAQQEESLPEVNEPVVPAPQPVETQLAEQTAPEEPRETVGEASTGAIDSADSQVSTPIIMGSLTESGLSGFWFWIFTGSVAVAVFLAILFLVPSRLWSSGATFRSYLPVLKGYVWACVGLLKSLSNSMWNFFSPAKKESEERKFGIEEKEEANFRQFSSSDAGRKDVNFSKPSELDHSEEDVMERYRKNQPHAIPESFKKEMEWDPSISAERRKEMVKDGVMSIRPAPPKPEKNNEPAQQP